MRTRHNMTIPTLVATLASSAALLAGCASMGDHAATAQLQPTRGSPVNGEIRLVQRGDKVLVSGEVRGLVPGSVHGFHVHDKGDCSAPDGTSAGGHFNPDGHAHGASDATVHHVGDLPSLRADAQGVAQVSFESADLSLREGAHNVLGRSLIVHRDADDYTSQPAGNSGPRLACGVISPS